MLKKTFILLALCLLIFPIALISNTKKKNEKPVKISYDERLYNALEWRCIGPFRGGRSAAVTSVPNKLNLYYFGATGGGVWRSSDAGNSWENISDGYFGGSIGAIAVSDWDPNVIYVGEGEVTIRGNVSSGTGIWKSTDAGKSWKSLGLLNSKHIPRIRIHPKNPDLVYVAVLGDLFKSSDERGVYRSKDGGEHWEKVLFVNADAGAVDLIMDPNNPRILYACTWKIRRTPYSLESGGEGSAIWKSTDGGDTWKNISKNKGLPSGIWGISGITVSPVNSNKVWAIIENQEGGVFRSDNAGETWMKVNDDRNLRQRAWYYTRIYADTQNEDWVYVLNVAYHLSKDGGKTFNAFYALHGDNHDLWIAPEDNQRMIIANDGGAQISYDGGKNWSTYFNQPTAQFYRVTTDNHFPYRIYGAQQDNSTVRIFHRTDGYEISERDWESTAGFESAHIAIDPEDNDIVYGGNYDGQLYRLDHKTNQNRFISVWPNLNIGHGVEDMKYRFNWNFPVFFSPHDPDKLYATSNYIHVSYDEGQSWQVISPDLTRNDTTKQKSSGGPITKDNTSVEYYCNIFAACESPYEKDLIWTGSDDGLVHISRDGGITWKNVTPKDMPEWMMINSIDPDPFTKGGAYIAGTRYKLGDDTPYLYKTKDYGQSWTKITGGIPSEHFTRVVRADKKRKGLLYAGTERGMYISFDDGVSWKSFQLNLPIVPITDLTIKNDNLIAATQGRSFWIIDDLTPLCQLNETIRNSEFYLYEPLSAWRMNGTSMKGSKKSGENHPGGVLFHFYFRDSIDKDTVVFQIKEMNGELVKSFSNKPNKEAKEESFTIKKGMNRFVWDMSYTNAEGFDGMILWWATLNGPKALPGKYIAELILKGERIITEFEIKKDPRSTITLEELKEQFDFIRKAQNKFSETSKAILNIRKTRQQFNTFIKNYDEKSFEDIHDKAKNILNEITTIEETLYQTKTKSGQDLINYPVQLNNKLAHLATISMSGDNAPTEQALKLFEEFSMQIDEELQKLDQIFKKDIPEFNHLVHEKELDLIKIDI